MSNPEISTNSGDRPKTRRARLVGAVVALALVGGGAALTNGILREKHEHQVRVHDASEKRQASMRAVFDAVNIKPRGGAPKEKSQGCGDDDEYCRLNTEADYETTSIHTLASTIDDGFRRLGLISTRGFGTDASLVEAAGKPQFTVEYVASASTPETIDGSAFYWSASIECKTNNTAPRPHDLFASQPGTCTAEISWNEEVTSGTSSGGFH